MFELLRRYARWIDSAFLVFWFVLFTMSVVSRNWFWACIAGIWVFREAFGLVRPGTRDEDVDDTPGGAIVPYQLRSTSEALISSKPGMGW